MTELKKSARKTGYVLLNLGTPDQPDAEAVGRYLKQFLMDSRVIDIPYAFRWFLVNALIIPKRKHTSAEAYAKVWTKDGSPLLYHTRELTNRVREELGSHGGPVELAMRYGNPSVRSAFESLRSAGCDEIIVFPLYPQYAESSTGTAHEECRRAAKEIGLTAKLKFIPPFYGDAGFIESFAQVIAPVLEREKPDHLLFSYHGLPERHVKATDPTGKHCLQSASCCDRIVDANRCCYRAHCFETTRKLVTKLNLKPGTYTVSFQSRLGRTPWIQPFTDLMYKELADKGVKRLAVVCPSFTADCLETVEEIGIRGSEDFKAAGGQELIRIPCVNSEPSWVKAVCGILQRASV